MNKSKKIGIILVIGLVLFAIIILLPYFYLSGGREYQEVTIPAEGYQLAGYISVGTDPEGEWIVMVHGNRKEGQAKELYQLIRQNLPPEVSVLAIDMRGFGASSNTGMEQAEDILLRLEDIEAASKYLKSEYGVNENQVILIGHSLGAAQVLRSAQNSSYHQAIPIGLGYWDGLLENERLIKTYTEKFFNNTGVTLSPERVKEEAGEFSSTALFGDCPAVPSWLIFASADDGLSPLAPSYQEAGARCPEHVRWSVIPVSDHMFGTENRSLPKILKDFRSRVMISLLMWNLDRILDV